MGKYKIIREIVREVMRDGNAHTAEELHKMCEKRGVEINSNRAEIYNTVHQLKKKGRNNICRRKWLSTNRKIRKG